MKPWLVERAARTPRAIALETSAGSQSYAELAERAGQRAAALARRGIAPGERVALLIGNRVEFAEWLHAAALARVILVPLNVRLAPAELARQLTDAGALAPRARRGRARADRSRRGGRRGRARARERRARGGGAPGAAPDLALSEPAVIVYTSGTSGEPKGVVLTHGNLLASAVGSAFHLGALPSDRWLACLPLFHVGGLAILVRSALAGSAVVLHERFDAAAVSRALDAQAITLASLVPTMLARVLEARAGAPPPACAARGPARGSGRARAAARARGRRRAGPCSRPTASARPRPRWRRCRPARPCARMAAACVRFPVSSCA